jgi:anti-sigma B factor antagonist
VERSHFSIETDRSDGRVVVTLHGELDIDTATQLETALAQELGRDQPVVLDLRPLTFIDSSGMRALVTARRSADTGRRELTIVAPTGPPARVIEMLKLGDVLRLVERPPSGD